MAPDQVRGQYHSTSSLIQSSEVAEGLFSATYWDVLTVAWFHNERNIKKRRGAKSVHDKESGNASQHTLWYLTGLLMPSGQRYKTRARNSPKWMWETWGKGTFKSHGKGALVQNTHKPVTWTNLLQTWCLVERPINIMLIEQKSTEEAVK